MLKLKLPKPGNQDGTAPPPQSEPATPSGIVRLKLKTSQSFSANDRPSQSPISAVTGDNNADAPPKKKLVLQRPSDGSAAKSGSNKRAAEDTIVSPAVKRVASGPIRKLSLKLASTAPGGSGDAPRPPRPTIALKSKRRPTMPKLLDIRAKGQPPPRPPGVGYDSEDSETEKDPAIQQCLILRMEPGEDADYLREAIANGKVGPQISQGDAEVSIKFIEPSYRRAVVRVRSRMYAAALVELPCIVETMKSFDRKGWWKVADIAQMLLVLGPVKSEDEARALPLPREVNKDNFQYAHGITPPMHWVRRRRFRKRISYNQIANVEEEVERLLAADRQCAELGGSSSFETMTREEYQRSTQDPRYGHDLDADADADADADGDAIETTEMDGPETYDDGYDDTMLDGDDGGADDDLDAAALEAEMLAEFNSPDVGPDVSASPAPIVDQAASMAAVEHVLAEDSEVATPAEMTQDEEDESDEDESDEDDEDSPDVVDEDAAARAAERAQQLEEVADLEREVDKVKQKIGLMTNQLLRNREALKLKQLEEDLRVKKQVFGLNDDDDEDEV